MGNLAVVYQHIADILSFKVSNSELEKTLNNPSFNWDNIVKEGSKHLILPAIYCRLKAKNLLHILPDDLNIYLKEITMMNRNRNLSIIEQVCILSKLFNSNKINHVFLKGTALISSNYYDDISERMIGDIDILVSLDQLDLAFNLLKNNGYHPIEQTFGSKFFEHKHLPRLTTKDYICAVELHRKLFVSHKDDDLSNSNILKHKQSINKIFIPSQKHLAKHNILNYQINDQGDLYKSVSFRSAYDTISILEKDGIDLAQLTNKSFRIYYRLTGLFFKDIHLLTHLKTNISTSFYLFKLNHIKFYKFWNTLLKYTDYFIVVIKRIPFIIINKDYRSALFSDRKRIIRHLMSVLKNS